VQRSKTRTPVLRCRPDRPCPRASTPRRRWRLLDGMVEGAPGIPACCSLIGQPPRRSPLARPLTARPWRDGRRRAPGCCSCIRSSGDRPTLRVIRLAAGSAAVGAPSGGPEGWLSTLQLAPACAARPCCASWYGSAASLAALRLISGPLAQPRAAARGLPRPPHSPEPSVQRRRQTPLGGPAGKSPVLGATAAVGIPPSWEVRARRVTKPGVARR